MRTSAPANSVGPFSHIGERTQRPELAGVGAARSGRQDSGGKGDSSGRCRLGEKVAGPAAVGFEFAAEVGQVNPQLARFDAVVGAPHLLRHWRWVTSRQAWGAPGFDNAQLDACKRTSTPLQGRRSGGEIDAEIRSGHHSDSVAGARAVERPTAGRTARPYRRVWSTLSSVSASIAAILSASASREDRMMMGTVGHPRSPAMISQPPHSGQPEVQQDRIGVYLEQGFADVDHDVPRPGPLE